MNKFKVGDKVRVIKGLQVGQKYDGCLVTKEMGKSAGCEVTIAEMNPFGISNRYGIKEYFGYFSSEMLEPVETKLMAYDLMKLATENPGEYEGKRYKCVRTKFADGLGRLRDEIIIKNGRFAFVDDGSGFTVFISNDTELEEIKPEPQPVSFMEAVKAYSKGKKIRCGQTIYTSESGMSSAFTSNDLSNGTYLNCREILHGEWFIEP
jgi:hypothetical protein